MPRSRRRRYGGAALCLFARLGAVLASAGTSCGVASEGEEIVFDCGGALISAVKFASFGQPRGRCGELAFYVTPACHAPQTMSSLEDRCLGQATCLFVVTASTFGGEPQCSGGDAKRWLSAVLVCGDANVAVSSEAAGGLGPGWQFNIFVLFVFVAYCGAGVAYNYHRKGAHGVEALPHLETWKDLPALVKDGVVFSIDTIKSKGRPGYDDL